MVKRCGAGGCLGPTLEPSHRSAMLPNLRQDWHGFFCYCSEDPSKGLIVRETEQASARHHVRMGNGQRKLEYCEIACVGRIASLYLRTPETPACALESGRVPL